MSELKRSSNRNSVPAKKKTRGIFVASGILVVLIAAFFVFKGLAGPGVNPGIPAVKDGGGISITKSDITEKASFFPYQSGDTKMEVIAVKAPDGTIRTALNTCQVCYDSGRGYYVQEGSELVCQNCRNRFQISQIEKQKNGCNPVPVPEESKTDDGKTITIADSFLEQNAPYFLNWKK